MLQPTIGIPLMGRSLFHRYMQYKYIQYLERDGAQVLLLPPDNITEVIAQSLQRCQGFLFPGGPDIQPGLYDQTALPECGKTDPARDALELPLLQAALEAEKPLFCICRGMQLLNVALGGTLIQDIKAEQEYPHFDFWHRTTATHPVQLEPGSHLCRLFGSDMISTNSLHHQAVDLTGKGLTVTGQSPDGFIEAMQIKGYPFCIAIQWHPEHMAAQSAEQRKLFRAFVDACKAG